MDVSGEGLMLTDCEGRISVCNKYAELILRAEQKSAPEEGPRLLPPVAAELQESFFHVRKTQHSVENEIFRPGRKDLRRQYRSGAHRRADGSASISTSGTQQHPGDENQIRKSFPPGEWSPATV